MYATINLETPRRDSLTDITDQIRDAVREAGIQSGVCHVIVPHTTAGVTINSYLDPDTAKDIVEDVRRLIPTRTDFRHIVDTPSDAAGHVKTTIVGNSVTVLVEEGQLVLGGSQGVLFYDFDGPRQRRVLVKLLAG